MPGLFVTRTVDPRQQSIYDAVRRIPPGRVASYGQIAAQAGLPGRARMVGRVLRDGPEGLPWHRVITAAGRIAFPPGSDAFAEQCRRLSEEGVPCSGGRVAASYFDAPATLDQLLWAPALDQR